jgi:UDP-glucose 4-epimerase
MAEWVLVTGGAGFIGSHTTVLLQQAGYNVVILDNLCNSDAAVLDAIAGISGTRPAFVQSDVRDSAALNALFAGRDVAAVLHFAGLKAAGESVEKPLSYYDNNVNGSTQLLRAAARAGVRTFIFSSSATVYGVPRQLPLTEDHPTAPINPYGHSKLMVEGILHDVFASDPQWRIALLRYFNPVGAHPSGLIGESPRGVPNNLMPYVAQVAQGRRPFLNVFGNDYDTADGTGVRDYIHVMDLAAGHIAALRHCREQAPGVLTVNLGTGNGYSVMDMIDAFEKASGRPVPFQLKGRRAGDVAACWADAGRASSVLGWRAALGIDAMCRDAWRWAIASRRAR